MSAFVVAPRTIDRCVVAVMRIKGQSGKSFREFLPCMSKLLEVSTTRLGTSLFRMNVRAVSQRYESVPDKARPYRFEGCSEFGISAGQAAKSLSCLHYQCSEGTIVRTRLYMELEVAKDLSMSILEAKLLKEHNLEELKDGITGSKEYREAEWDTDWPV